MRRLILALAGATTIGWAVNRLFLENGERPISLPSEATRDRRPTGRAPKKRTPPGPAPVAGPDSSYNVALQRPHVGSAAVALPEEEVASEPANVVDLGAFRKRHRRERTASGPAAAQGRQTEKARMKRARDAVDERFRKLPKKGDGGGRAAA